MFIKKIKNIILDLGGVLLNVDYDAPVREFKKLGIENFDLLFAKTMQSEIFDTFEKGEITNEKFRHEIRRIAGKKISDQEIDNAWNSILLDFPGHRIELLKDLKLKYRLFLLSNTNEIHIESFESNMNNEAGENSFKNYFEKIYYSSRLGLRKPDKEIFEFVLKENNLLPEETVFIDDSMQHVAGANAAGINAIHLDVKKEDIKDLLKRENLI